MPFFSISSPTSGNATQLQGNPINATAPATGTVLTFNGSSWGAAQGVTGPTGSHGADGHQIFWGTTGPAANIGRSGDFYIDGASGVLYGPKANNAWGSGLLLQSGPTGPTGATGAVGATGAASNVTGPTGSAGPTGSTGPASTVTGPTGEMVGIAVGAVTTGVANVTVTGTGASRTLHFVLPFVTGPASTVTGPTGAAGVTGPTGAASTVTGPTGPPDGPTGPTGPSGMSGSFSDAQSINAQVTGYTFALADAGRLVTFSNTTGTISAVIPAASSVAFPTGTHIDIARIGDAGVTITGATGVTVNATPGSKLRAKFSAGTAILYSGDTWIVVGDLSS